MQIRYSRWLWMAGLLLMCMPAVCGAAVEWDLRTTLPTNETPLDVAVSEDGKYTFVLLENGRVEIFLESGKLEDTIDTGIPAVSITVAPAGDKLYMTDRSGKAVKVVALDFIQPINTAGAPFKGPESAPVVVAVFSDFQ